MFPARLERGAGLPAVERLGYLAEFALAQLDGVRHLVLVDAKPPVSFFAYPDKPSDLVPDGCEVHMLALGIDDVALALEQLADAVGAEANGAPRQPARGPSCRPGALERARRSARRSARCCPRARSSPTKRRPVGCSCPARPRARRATTG